VRTRVLSSIALTSVLILAFSATALGQSSRTIQILDNCDGPSFNAVLGEGACVNEEGLPFDVFFSKLFKGGAQGWRFSPEQATVTAGGTVTAVNRGGEFHTFTGVAEFGGGCVPEINEAMGLEPVAECGDPSLFGTTGVPPGASLTTPIEEGANLFQCLIHPWQRATVWGA
jgi:plastocyanin